MAREHEQNIRREASQIQQPHFTVRKSEGRWGLCPDAEVFLYDDIFSGEVILVNDTFLMKSTGQDVGVAVVEQEVEGGKIELGRWYGPEDWTLRKTIREAVRDGETKINIPGKSAWIADRELRQNIWDRNVTAEGLMDLAQKMAERIRAK